MRILHVADRLSDRGGADLALLGLLDALSDRHDMHLAVGRDQGGVRPRCPVSTVQGLDARIRAGVDLAPLIERLRPDLVHVHNVVNPAVLEWAAGLDAVMTVQDHRFFCPGRGKWTADGRVCGDAMGRDACAGCFDDPSYFEGALELTGERAHGWLGTSFVPDRADVFLEPLARGAARAGRTLSDLDIQAGGRLRITDDVSGTVAKLKPELAFMLGAMGSAANNFYNDAFRRAGWEDEAREVQRLWLDRRRDEAAAAVPDDLVLRGSLIGAPDMVRERIRLYRDAGVTTLRLSPIGDTVAERLDQLAQALELHDWE